MVDNGCDVCSRLWKFFGGTGEKHPVDLGSFEEALSSPCLDHTEIIRAFRDQVRVQRNGILPKTSDLGFLHHEGDSITLTQSVTELGVCWELLLAEDNEQDDHPGIGRVLDPDWVDLQIAQAWKDKCLEEHGSKCMNPMKVAPVTPDLLVDVEKQCVVHGIPGSSYIALSYRWGDVTDFRLDAGSFERLKEPNSLKDADVSERIPSMIQHAIQLTKMLGERYLWVDALCILHGGHASTAAQINLMSAIYTHAVLTIVAADGVATDELLGIKGTSASRNFEQKIFKFGMDHLIVRDSSVFSLTHYGDYHKRSWTYQEFVQSPRKLLFHSNQLHWQCQCKVWHEEINLNGDVQAYIDPRPGVINAGFPDLESLAHSLSNYNERNLTYDEDALSGIAGLLSVYSRTFTGGFLFGCPEMFFDHALAWSPYWSFTKLRRRTPSNRPEKTQLQASALPSWSWLGWQGSFSLHYGEAARINDRQYQMLETIPITDWYTSNSIDGPRRRIRSTWFENRDSFKDLTKPLPDGWTRHDASEVETFRNEPRLFPDGCDGTSVFSHRDMLSDECKYWYYPFPVPVIDTTTPMFTPEQTQYLFCSTEKASLFAHRADYEETLSGETHVLKLRHEPASEIIGSLHLHTAEQYEQWPEVENEESVPKGQLIELTAISCKITYRKTFNKELQHYDHPLLREEHYNVLWLEWQGGIAYRKAVGQVKKGAWESLAKQRIDLVLG